MLLATFMSLSSSGSQAAGSHATLLPHTGPHAVPEVGDRHHSTPLDSVAAMLLHFGHYKASCVGVFFARDSQAHDTGGLDVTSGAGSVWGPWSNGTKRG